MNIFKITLLGLCTTLLVFNCKGQDTRYSALKNVYIDLVEALKSGSDEKLRTFCYNLAIDRATEKYMLENSLCYRAIPCRLKEAGYDLAVLGDKFFPVLQKLRTNLSSSGLLSDLEFVQAQSFQYDTATIEIYIHKQSKKAIPESTYYQLKDNFSRSGKNIDEVIETKIYKIPGSEMSVRLKSGTKTINYHLGEMIFINNKWSLFTSPRPDFSLYED